MIELIRNVMVLTGAIAVVGLAGSVRVLRWWGYLAVVVGAVGVAAFLGVVDRRWAWESLGADVSWGPVLALAAWGMLGRSAYVRPRGWGYVVALAAVAGDLLVATGLALSEPDPSRRARLVLAASAASMVGPVSGAGAVVLGWAGWEVAVVGLVLSLVGVRAGEHALARGAVDPSGLLFAAAAAVGGGLAAWLGAASGALEFLAQGLERAPLEFPDQQGALVTGAGVLLGMLGDEGTWALCFHGALERALSIREGMVPAWMVAGLAVGNGLPMLLATGSSLRVGLPLWLLQVIGVLGWAWSR